MWLSKICLKYDKIALHWWFFMKFCDDTLKLINSTNMKENSNLKWIKVMKSTSKLKLKHLLLSITFNDNFWSSQLDFLHLSIKYDNKDHHEKKFKLNNALLLFRPLTKRFIFWVYWTTFLVHFTMLTPMFDGHSFSSLGGCTVLNMYVYTWVHTRGINLNIVVLCIHTINTFKTENYTRILTLNIYLKRNIHVYKGI